VSTSKGILYIIPKRDRTTLSLSLEVSALCRPPKTSIVVFEIILFSFLKAKLATDDDALYDFEREKDDDDDDVKVLYHDRFFSRNEFQSSSSSSSTAGGGGGAENDDDDDEKKKSEGMLPTTTSTAGGSFATMRCRRAEGQRDRKRRGTLRRGRRVRRWVRDSHAEGHDGAPGGLDHNHRNAESGATSERRGRRHGRG
jgi:hypothetical protein